MYDIVEQKGFTLIEIMVAVVIVAILASFAYPSYLESVRKAKRAEARAALMQLMQQQERYYSQNNRYIAFSSESAGENGKSFPGIPAARRRRAPTRSMAGRARTK
jgi:type IV pilus assembly protein PilE